MKTKAIVVLLLLLVLCSAIPFVFGSLARNSSPWYGTDEVLDPHRADFSSEIPAVVSEALGEDTDIMKVYPSLPRTGWFLMEDFEDFSQIVRSEPVYVVPEDGNGNPSDKEYTRYVLANSGEVSQDGGASIAHSTRPYGLFGLSNELIQTALTGIDYEDYIITDSSAVIVWVRRESGDLFLTYPTRPDLMGIQVGNIYTLEELKATLAEAYHGE